MVTVTMWVVQLDRPGSIHTAAGRRYKTLSQQTELEYTLGCVGTLGLRPALHGPLNLTGSDTPTCASCLLGLLLTMGHVWSDSFSSTFLGLGLEKDANML